MALNFGKGNRSIAFAPTAAFPLNANSYFESYDLALAAALTAKPAGDTTTKYYFGQEIAVAEMVDNVPQSAKLYIIAPTVDEEGNIVGTLNEVGSATDGDGVSIELVDGVLSVKDFGKRYYKYIAAVEGGAAAHYELTEGWIAGLEPRVVEVDDEMIIGWYEPNPTTVEGVKDQVVEVQGQVDDVKEDVQGLEDILNGTEEAPGLIEEVSDIADVLYGTEGENPVPGLIEDVKTLDGEIDAVAKNLADNYYTKAETYNKTEIDGLVSGVFHFEGTAESYEALPSENNTKGDVYQVGDKEYAWNGSNWVELGYVIDLSGYYTKEEVNTEVKKVQDALDLVEETIEAHTTSIGNLEDADSALDERIDGVDSKIANLETADATINESIDDLTEKVTNLETADETINGKISGLEAVDTGFETRIGTLEDYVGTPTQNLGALYPVVESLNERLEGIVAGGGEPNQINGVSISGTKLVPNEAKIIDLPIFAGSTAGLVPVATEDLTNYHVLTAKGNWSNPFGDLGDKTVKDYVDDAIDSVAILWDSIV